MVDTKYKSTNDVMTEHQWLKKGYIVKDKATGIDGWNNRHCTYGVIRYTREEVYEDIEEARARLRKIRHEAYKKSKEKKAYWTWFAGFRDKMKTENQWVYLEKRKPKRNAKWHIGEELNKEYHTCSFGSSHYYCHYDDTEEIVEENVKPIDN